MIKKPIITLLKLENAYNSDGSDRKVLKLYYKSKKTDYFIPLDIKLVFKPSLLEYLDYIVNNNLCFYQNENIPNENIYYIDDIE